MYGLLLFLHCKYRIHTSLLHDMSILSLRPISRFDNCRLSLISQLSLLFLFLAVAFGDICFPFTYVQACLSSLSTVISLISLYRKISLKLLLLFFGGPFSSGDRSFAFVFLLLIFLLVIFTVLLLILFSVSCYRPIPWSSFFLFLLIFTEIARTK